MMTDRKGNMLIDHWVSILVAVITLIGTITAAIITTFQPAIVSNNDINGEQGLQNIDSGNQNGIQQNENLNIDYDDDSEKSEGNIIKAKLIEKNIFKINNGSILFKEEEILSENKLYEIEFAMGRQSSSTLAKKIIGGSAEVDFKMNDYTKLKLIMMISDYEEEASDRKIIFSNGNEVIKEFLLSTSDQRIYAVDIDITNVEILKISVECISNECGNYGVYFGNTQLY
jgi:hypothetical protein